MNSLLLLYVYIRILFGRGRRLNVLSKAFLSRPGTESVIKCRISVRALKCDQKRNPFEAKLNYIEKKNSFYLQLWLCSLWTMRPLKHK